MLIRKNSQKFILYHLHFDGVSAVTLDCFIGKIVVGLLPFCLIVALPSKHLKQRWARSVQMEMGAKTFTLDPVFNGTV